MAQSFTEDDRKFVGCVGWAVMASGLGCGVMLIGCGGGIALICYGVSLLFGHPPNSIVM